jgi:hypothetical protein
MNTRNCFTFFTLEACNADRFQAGSFFKRLAALTAAQRRTARAIAMPEQVAPAGVAALTHLAAF